jgi:hypothetical protein
MQLVALAELQVKVEDWPEVTEVGLALRVTLTAAVVTPYVRVSLVSVGVVAELVVLRVAWI